METDSSALRAFVEAVTVVLPSALRNSERRGPPVGSQHVRHESHLKQQGDIPRIQRPKGAVAGCRLSKSDIAGRMLHAPSTVPSSMETVPCEWAYCRCGLQRGCCIR